jgi:hypothetical protein
VAKTFELDATVSPTALLARAKKAAYENGATLFGDARSGRFSHGMAKGEYRMAGRKVIVTVTDKHWLLPWPVVEVRLREFVLLPPIARVESGPELARSQHRSYYRLGLGPRRLEQRRHCCFGPSCPRKELVPGGRSYSSRVRSPTTGYDELLDCSTPRRYGKVGASIRYAN